MKRITERAEFVAWSREQGMRDDWHEPDEQEITARVEGTSMDFDNAGFWPGSFGTRQRTELHVIFSRAVADRSGNQRRGEDLACVNLATLCAWATEYTGAMVNPR